MNRREIALALGGFVATAELPTVGISAAPAATGSEGNAGPAPARPKVGMLVYPEMILLDLVGPQTILSIAMAEIHLIGKTRDPVVTDVGIPIGPTATFADSPANLDILFAPGRLGGTVKLMRDREVLDFLADHGRRARYVTSVCTGSLLLAAAGLLRGYRAASQWYVRDLLPLMGATMATDRVVVDRNRITGGGVTAGLDFGLTLAAALHGDDTAQRIQLLLEYAPNPPCDAGEPETAGTSLVHEVLARRKPLIDAARAAAAEASAAVRE
jgi:cyclohexyl-isocyanide hydratase